MAGVPAMSAAEQFEADLVDYLQEARNVVLLELEGLGYRRAWKQVDAAVQEFAARCRGACAVVGPGGTEVTLHRVLVHVIGETHRHAGHADIVREMIDGSVGNQSVGDDLPDRDDAWWRDHRDRLGRVAEGFRAG